MIAIVRKEEAHKASLIFYGFKTHSTAGDSSLFCESYKVWLFFVCSQIDLIISMMIGLSRSQFYILFFCFDWTSSNHNNLI